MSLVKIQTLIEQRNFAEARKLSKGFLLRNKVNTDVLFFLGVAEAELGKKEEAMRIFSRVVAIDPSYGHAHYAKACILSECGRHLEALLHYDLATCSMPANPWAFLNRGISRAAIGKFHLAIQDFDAAIEMNPRLAAALVNKGNCYLELGDFEQACIFFDNALLLDSKNVEALSNRSASLSKLKHFENALLSADLAIGVKPSHTDAWLNRGNALGGLKRYEEALNSYDEVLKIDPVFAKAWGNRANTLCSLRRYEEAEISYSKALALNPSDADTLSNWGNMMSDLGKYQVALNLYQSAFSANSTKEFLLGSLLHTKLMLCDWTEQLDLHLATLKTSLNKREKVAAPFHVLALTDSPKLQRIAADVWLNGTERPLKSRITTRRQERRDIRVAYFSADFREHPVSELIVETIEHHDRKKFQVFGFSLGPDDRDPMRERLESAFDQFFNVEQRNDQEVFTLAQDLEIDIAVDLTGHTSNSRSSLFSSRVAPVQVNYLGYPGTWGSPSNVSCMDYIVGDRFTITPENLEFFSEKVLFLPNSFQANPTYTTRSTDVVSREVWGLPNDSFVFCCFNNTWKLNPQVFQSWMMILSSTKNSILWLYVDNPVAEENIRVAALSAGIDPERLVVAGRTNRNEYLSRLMAADLFLDTLPYNAGTTARDALWCGLPVLTQAGHSFSGRMASSLLSSVGIPELITNTKEEYENLAVSLANNPSQLMHIRERLRHKRVEGPLFNAKLFTKNLERAYQAAFSRTRLGLSPDHIYVN